MTQPESRTAEPDDDFEVAMAGFDRIIQDKVLQQRLLDAGLLVRIPKEPESRTVELAIHEALISEDEIAHGEAVKEGPDGYVRLGVCAYCDDHWPCRTQRGIDRLLATLAAAKEHGLVIGEGELDAAWKEAEAALPEGWAISDVRRRSVNGRYSASATLGGSEIGVNTSGHTSGLGVTPAAALRDLTERLRR